MFKKNDNNKIVFTQWSKFEKIPVQVENILFYG